MKKIKEQDARNQLFKLLEEWNIGDSIYEMAQEIRDRLISDVESAGMVVDNNGNDYEDYETWYDDIHDDFNDIVYNKAKEFLNTI